MSLPSSAAAFPHGVIVLPASLPVSFPSVELCSESLMTAGAERVRTLSERGDSQRTDGSMRSLRHGVMPAPICSSLCLLTRHTLHEPDTLPW